MFGGYVSAYGYENGIYAAPVRMVETEKSDRLGRDETDVVVS